MLKQQQENNIWHSMDDMSLCDTKEKDLKLKKITVKHFPPIKLIVNTK